jgi:hypothetical protein
VISRALLRYLDGLGLLVYGRHGADAFLEELPDKPVAAVGAFARPGAADTDGGNGYDSPGVQFLVRGDPDDPQTPGRAGSGFTRAADIRKALHGLTSLTLAEGTADEVWLVQCLAVQSQPVSLGVDADNRPKWSVEVQCEVYEPTPLRA